MIKLEKISKFKLYECMERECNYITLNSKDIFYDLSNNDFFCKECFCSYPNMGYFELKDRLPEDTYKEGEEA